MCPGWHADPQEEAFWCEMPEPHAQLRHDSRWPAFFPCSLSFATVSYGSASALERLVGVSIVNRFPYVMALSVCRENLSRRHHPRTRFMDLLERGGTAAVHFLNPGASLDRLLDVCRDIPESQTSERISESGLPFRSGVFCPSPVFEEAYLVYEGELARPGRDFDGRNIFSTPWLDVGSHRIYFLEVRAIQLRKDIADGQSRIRWRSLPHWSPLRPLQEAVPAARTDPSSARYIKPYTPFYEFPSERTTRFDADTVVGNMAVKLLPSARADQIETDNDRARWPCFFPSSLGMITTWVDEGIPNLMPCGSTTVVSRQPLVIAPCVGYASINDRYARRATLDLIRRSGRFGCGVPFIDDTVVDAIRYAGNVSVANDPDKVRNAGLSVLGGFGSPILPALPIHFDCDVIGEQALGTHVMFLGEVRRIRVRADVTPDNPIQWLPWPVVSTGRVPIRKGLCPAEKVAQPSSR